MVELGNHNIMSINIFLGIAYNVSDDDLSGNFTHLPTLADWDHKVKLIQAQNSQTWLNYIVAEPVFPVAASRRNNPRSL